MIAWLLTRAALRVWLVAEPLIRRGVAARARAAAVHLRASEGRWSSSAAALECLAEELER